MQAKQALLLAGLFAVTGVSRAEPELLPADRPIADAIDHYIDQRLAEAKVAPAPPADASALARRLYLDLAGRIPTAAEARAYASSTDPDKRLKLIDTLLSAPDLARHNATEFDELLHNDNREAPSVRNYLLVAFRENRPWDRMFRELLGVQSDPARPEQFVVGRLKDADALTRDVSSVFFGLNVSCAQCHRHPYIKSLTQDYYYGMKAFFAGSYDIRGNLLERQTIAPVTFKPKGGEQRNARLLFLNGQSAEWPPAPEDLNRALQEEAKRIAEFTKNYDKTKELPPAPEFSARRSLAELALGPDGRDRFARAIVNRLWDRFYGRGLVMGVDQMHAKNPASHPELLDWLSRDLIANGYDLRRLMRGLVSSRAYARDSRWERDPAPAPDLFAVAAIRPLTPMQWGVSHRLASNPARLKPGSDVEKQLEQLEREAQGSFGTLIERPRAGLQVSAAESLRLSNDPAMLKLTGDQLVPAMLQLKERRQQIEDAVWAVLSRAPTEKEHELLGAYLEERKDHLADALRQVVWALINSPEFRFNH